jgi:sigma-B regulation protein RsbU (phosphoserine phosphatase)
VPRVLVVEDEPEIAFGLQAALRYEGFDVEVVDNGAVAVGRGADDGFDLILLDAMLPGRDGFDVCRELRRAGVQTPIIFLTARAIEADRIAGLELGANDYVTKPFSTRELVARMRGLLRVVDDGRRDRRQLEHEFEAAARVQQRLLPREPPAVAGLDVAGVCRPARGVGGDYFDFIALPEGRLGLVVADVCGKGMPAALLAASVHAAVRAYAPAAGRRCGAVLASVNRLLYDTTPEERFVTIFYGVYDPAERTLTWANAGHCPPLLVRSSSCVRLDPLTPPAGMLPAIEPVERTVRLAAGDSLLVVSDGIPEAEDPSGAEFGEERLLELARRERPRAAAGLCEAVLGHVRTFVGGRGQADDQTVVAALVTGA